MTPDEVILGQAKALAMITHKYEMLKISYDNLCTLRSKEADALAAYVEKYGPELKDEIMSVPF